MSEQGCAKTPLSDCISYLKRPGSNRSDALIDRLSTEARELEAQVSQLTSERDEAREVAFRLSLRKYVDWCIAGGPEACIHGYAKGIPCPGCDKRKAEGHWGEEVIRNLPAEPAWRADSARLGVTEAEVLKDLAPKETP